MPPPCCLTNKIAQARARALISDPERAAQTAPWRIRMAWHILHRARSGSHRQTQLPQLPGSA